MMLIHPKNSDSPRIARFDADGKNELVHFLSVLSAKSAVSFRAPTNGRTTQIRALTLTQSALALSRTATVSAPPKTSQNRAKSINQIRKWTANVNGDAAPPDFEHDVRKAN
jgi:hypothetical protein